MVTNRMQEFRVEAGKHGLCAKYAELWDKAKTIEELQGLALDMQGLEFIAKAYAEGWGMPLEYVRVLFPEIVTGKAVGKHKDYTTQIFFEREENVMAKEDVILLVNCKCAVIIGDNDVKTIMVSGDSDVTVINDNGYCNICIYGSGSKVRHSGCGDFHERKILN